jgi:hypothetical protein
MAIEGDTIKCDAGNCPHKRRFPGMPAKKIEAAAKRLGWHSVGESDYCPDCR